MTRLPLFPPSTLTSVTAPLAGFTVLSRGGSLAASLAARLLADQGVTLLLAAPPVGTAADPLDRWLTEGGHEAGPGASADIVVETHAPGAPGNGAADALVHAVLRGFAADDPQGRADWPCDDGLAGAAAGLFTDVNPFGALLGLDPIYTALPLPSVYAAVHAATGVVMALLRGGRGGSPERVEVTLHGAMLSAMGSMLLRASPQPSRYDIPPVPRPLKRTLVPMLRAAYRRGNPRRRLALLSLAERLIPPLMDSYRCADRRLLYVLAMDHARMPLAVLRETGLETAWRRAGFVERNPYVEPGLTNNLADPSGLSRRAQTRLRAGLARAFATRPAAEWEARLNAAGVACAIQCSTTQWRASAHARQSGLLRAFDDPGNQTGQVAPGPLVWLAGTIDKSVAGVPVDAMDDGAGGDATRWGNEAEKPGPSLPLAGLRVLDLSTMLAGPVCARTLAEYGADVLKIDAPRPLFGPRMTCWYGLDVNRGKRSALLDLKRPDGRAAFLQLVREADLVVHNFRTGVLERSGVGPGDARRVNPHVTYVAVSAYGGPRPGPKSGWPGFDPVLQAATGVMVRYGSAEKPVLHAIASCIDYLTGFAAAFAAALATLARRRGHLAAEAATSLAAAAQLAQLPFLLGQVAGSGNGEISGQDARGWNARHRLYQARDGWLFLSAEEGDLGRFLGLHVADTRDGKALGVVTLMDAFAAEPIATWQRRCAGAAGIFVQPVTGIAEISAAPDHVGVPLEASTHPSGFSLRVLRPAYARFSSFALRPASPTPKPGAHTAAVLAGAGLDADFLLAAGVAAESLAPDHLPE